MQNVQHHSNHRQNSWPSVLAALEYPGRNDSKVAIGLEEPLPKRFCAPTSSALKHGQLELREQVVDRQLESLRDYRRSGLLSKADARCG